MGFNIGWIDFSKSDRDKALEMLRLLQEPGAVDELGIGIVRDAFADRFFPGTSTLLTRAKYFVAVPYIIHEKIDEGAERGWSAKQTLKEVNEEEHRLARKLIDANERLGRPIAEQGIIGRIAINTGKWVKRSPSELYWNGIRTFGICGARNLSLLQYIEVALLASREKGKTLGTPERGEMNEGDDQDAGCSFGLRPFDIGGIYNRGWGKDVTIDLTKEEAAYLRDKIQTNIGKSVFASALRYNINLMQYAGDFAAFAETMRDRVDGDTRRLLELACYFREIVYVARVRYNILLQGDRSDEAKKLWVELLDNGLPREMLIKEVLSALQIDRQRYPQLVVFLFRLEQFLHEQDWKSLDDLIRNREKEIKGSSRAKLLQPEKYPADNWIGGKYLDYRLGTVAQIASDIYEGLEIENA